ncbi:MAG: hypothetical protein P8Q20_08830 [Acidimicrobiales bacterium]|nr:hypothetical protein [Acidimicrobiales bacterium]
MSSEIEDCGGRFIDDDGARCCPEPRDDAVAEKPTPPAFRHCDQFMCGSDAPDTEIG